MKIPFSTLALLFFSVAQAAFGQAARSDTRPPIVLSPEVTDARTVIFRIYAPDARVVKLNGSDIPGNGAGLPMARNAEGVWEVTAGPLPPGAYRYTFDVDSVPTIDPHNPATSESFNNVWSLVVVPGSEWMDTRDVPHGAVASVTYYSRSLGQFRRMHIYTPPGYEKGRARFPVFYLLHGAGDSDNAWSTVGRAGVIMDNLIAAGRARPMVVVMPAGHIRQTGSHSNEPESFMAGESFERDFVNAVMPDVEKRYRIYTDRGHTAIAGLSMGGGQTLNVFLANPKRFGYVGVFSSGLFGAYAIRRPGAGAPGATFPPQPDSEWMERHRAELDSQVAKEGLRLLWFGVGQEDFLLPISHATVDLLKAHGFNPVFHSSPGGHTWLNWRDYLILFAPQLFQQ